MDFDEFDAENPLTKEIIIRLIQADLKHNQLTAGLRKLGLDTETHHLPILHIIEMLMGIEHANTTDLWGNLYFNFLEQASQVEISNLGTELRPLAEQCYYMLIDYWKLESKKELLER